MPSFPAIQQDQYTATVDTQGIVVYIPAGDEYKALLAGMIDSPSDAANYASPDSAQAEGVAASWADALALMDWSEAMTPSQMFSSRLVLWGAEMGLIAGAGWQWNQLTSQDLEGYWRQSPGALNDEIQAHFALPTGIYRLDLFGIKSSGFGKQQITWNGNAFPTTIDWYSATGLPRQLVQPGYDITLTDNDGLTLNSKITGKNASSSGYLCGITWMKIRRTGDV